MFTMDVKQQNNNNNKKNYSGGGGLRKYVCVAWWKGAGVTFGNSALLKDRHIGNRHMTDVGEGAGDSVES